MLALWQYEWDESDWSGSASSATATDAFAGLLLALQWEGTATPAPTPTPADTPTVGGHGKKQNDYLGQDESFWLAKARYLRMFVKPEVEKVLPVAVKPTPSPASPDYAPLEDTITPYLLHLQALQAALQRAMNARNATDLQQAAQRTRTLALDIQKLQQQDYERAIEILLLDVF